MNLKMHGNPKLPCILFLYSMFCRRELLYSIQRLKNKLKRLFFDAATHQTQCDAYVEIDQIKQIV